MAEYTEKKVKAVNGMVIALVTYSNGTSDDYRVYTKDEWSMGKGLRYAEFEDIDNIQEAIDQARNY